MAHYLRAPAGRKRIIPSGADEPNEVGRIHWQREGRPFVKAAPLVMHDDCAREHLGPELLPWSPGRAAFGELAGQPLCWSPTYGGAERCYWCGGIVP